MAKDLIYFPQHCNVNDNPAICALIQKYGMEGFGRYIFLKCILRRQPDYKYDSSKKFSFHSLSEMLKCTLEVSTAFINDLVSEFELCGYEGKNLFSFEIMEDMRPLDEKRSRMSERGRKGAEVTNKKRYQKVGDVSAQASDDVGTSEAQANGKVGKNRKDIEKKKNRNKNTPANAGYLDTSLVEDKSQHLCNTETKHLENTINANYSEDDNGKYKAFTDWITKNAANVAKMNEPFSIKQYMQLRKKIPDRKKVQDLLLKMHNWKPLRQKNNSAYLTILNWNQNDFGGNKEEERPRAVVI